MKRTPLLRRTPLVRKRLRSRGDSAYRRRPRDLDYMRWIRHQPCAVSGHPDSRCQGRMEADHAGPRAMGQKADDVTCIPLCHKHHVQRSSFGGVFRTWDKAQMRQWLSELVTRYQRLYRELALSP